MDRICDLAEKYDALVMVDESHSAGVVGLTGHGVSEQYGTYGRVEMCIRDRINTVYSRILIIKIF